MPVVVSASGLPELGVTVHGAACRATARKARASLGILGIGVRRISIRETRVLTRLLSQPYRKEAMKPVAPADNTPRSQAECCPSNRTDDPLELAITDVQLARLAKAIAHPVRVQILRLLLQHGVCVCGEICQRLPLAQSTVSQHLKVLREAGLIEGKADGPSVCYQVNEGGLTQLKDFISNL